MAGARQSKASHRRDVLAREATRQERITLGALGVLAAVAIIVAAGVVWGVILPRRAHIITVGTETFDAAAVAKRAELLVASGSQSQDDPVTAAVAEIRRDETLLQAAPAEVGDVSADDVQKEIRKRLGMADNATAAEYSTTYQEYLKRGGLERTSFERRMRAVILSDRLAAKFIASLGDGGPQYHLQGVSSSDENKVKQFREAVAGGADFMAKATEMGLSTDKRSADFDWLLPPTSGILKDIAHIDTVPAGQMTEVLQDNLMYFVFRVAERDEKRAYTDVQKTFLGNQRVTEWIDQQKDKVKVTQDISDSERTWILKRVLAAVQRMREQNSPPAGAR